jgi:hypothetical protein
MAAMMSTAGNSVTCVTTRVRDRASSAHVLSNRSVCRYPPALRRSRQGGGADLRWRFVVRRDGRKAGNQAISRASRGAIRYVAGMLAIPDAYVILVARNDRPRSRTAQQGSSAGSWFDNKIRRVKTELIAAATVERVASARGIACTWVQSTHLLCKSSLDNCASLSRNPNNYNSMY